MDTLCDTSTIFQLTPSRRATGTSRKSILLYIFQLTPSRRATISHCCNPFLCLISTHALTEGDNSPPYRFRFTFISTHALTEGDAINRTVVLMDLISTHALTEGDAVFIFDRRTLFISTHALTEGDTLVETSLTTMQTFQLTPSRRATSTNYNSVFECQISTHALTEGDEGTNDIFFLLSISTHALTEGDKTDILEFFVCIISTHALTEGDVLPGLPCIPGLHFNSRPHGGRLRSHVRRVIVERFQLTPSRRATITYINQIIAQYISTHALTEGDGGEPIFQNYVCHFNSRPHGGRLMKTFLKTQNGYFNSRPHGGRPRVTNGELYFETFQLTPSRRATQSRHECCVRWIFQLTPSRRATLVGKVLLVSLAISTHALTEGDLSEQRCLYCICHFNSRPHGGRHVLQILVEIRGVFQLTPSRRATAVFIFDRRTLLFQLTPSRRATIHR